MGNRETSCARRSGREASERWGGDVMLVLGLGLLCLIFGQHAFQHFFLLSFPPSVQAHAPSRQPQAENRRRGSRHDNGAVQAQRIDGAPMVWSAQCRESKADALLPEGGDNGVIVVAIWVAENRQALADFSLQIFQ